MLNQDAYLAMKAAGTLPGIGDKVRLTLMPDLDIFAGMVEATFYENGDGGMHVDFPGNGRTWVCCTDVTVIARACVPARRGFRVMFIDAQDETP